MTRHVCRQDDVASTNSTELSAEMSDIGKNWTSKDKIHQRREFAAECKLATRCSDLEHILYLEGRDGYATQALLDEGFKQHQLHPCNNCKGKEDADCEEKIKQKYPDVQFEKGNIIDIAKTRNWLGIWFDTTSTWHSGGVWNFDAMPKFDSAVVIAVNLYNRGLKGVTCEDLGHRLSDLLNDMGGHTSAQPRAYEGVGGCQNMIFGLATFPPPASPTKSVNKYIGAILYVPVTMFDNDADKYHWPSDWKGDYRIDARKRFTATVYDVVEGSRFLVKFMQKNGLPFNEPDDWWRPTIHEIDQYMKESVDEKMDEKEQHASNMDDTASDSGNSVFNKTIQKKKAKWYIKYCKHNPDGYRIGKPGRPPLSFQAAKHGISVAEMNELKEMLKIK